MEPSYPTRITRPPDFADEEWLRQAIHELETRPMTSEERYQLARITAKNAEAIHAEKRKIQEAKEAENLAVKTEAVKNLLRLSVLTTSQIADSLNVSEAFVRSLATDGQDA